MLATSEMKRNIAFEFKIYINKPLENSKVLCKFFKTSNPNNDNGTKIQE